MRLLATLGVLTVVALALYGNTLGGWFLADDFAFVERVHLQWTQDPWQFLLGFMVPPEHHEPGGFHRPLSLLVWGLDYLAWGIRPLGYRVTNLLIHIVSSLLIFRLAWRWTGGRRDISWLAALLFLVCPLHTEAVAWIAARDETLAVLFFLAVLNAVPVRGATSMSLAILGTLCAFWSKESALMLPVVVTGYYLLIPPPADRPLKDRTRSAILSSLWVWIVVLVYLADRYWVLGKFGGTYARFEPPDYLTLEYVGTRLTYWVLLFSPLEGETFPTWLRWAVGLATLGLVAFSFRDRRQTPVVLLLVCWTLLAPLPYLWENVDPHTLTHGRHLYTCYAPFSILLAIGATNVAGRLLPTTATRTLSYTTLIVLLCCATWLTKQAYVEAAELSRRITDQIHETIALARADAQRPDRLVLQDLPPIHGGAHLGINMVATSRPPFHEQTPFEVEVLDSGFFPLLVTSYIKEARDKDKWVVRYRWDSQTEHFYRKPSLVGSPTLRGVIEATDKGLRLAQHDIRLRTVDPRIQTELAALAGSNVELYGLMFPTQPDTPARTIWVTAPPKRVDPILQVPESVVAGSDLVVEVHGRPGSHYLLFWPGPAGFLPLHEYGTFLVDTNVEVYRQGRVPRSGVALERFQVPERTRLAKQTVYCQALITRQDESDPRLFVLTACPGFRLESRRQ